MIEEFNQFQRPVHVGNTYHVQTAGREFGPTGD